MQNKNIKSVSNTSSRRCEKTAETNIGSPSLEDRLNDVPRSTDAPDDSGSGEVKLVSSKSHLK